MDLPHAGTAGSAACLLSADDVVIVATPDLACLRNAKNLVDLIRQARPNDAPPKLVLNQRACPVRPEIPAKEFSAALGIEPTLVLPLRSEDLRAGQQQRPDAARVGPSRSGGGLWVSSPRS
jgi:pilus assembly protein CpaE